MKKISIVMGLFAFLGVQAQQDSLPPQGHANTKKFRQLYEEFATPNVYRNGSGAPGHEYYQQQADYEIKVTLDDEKTTLTGTEKITYTNNSPDDLTFLWLQLDQNKRSKDSQTPLVESESFDPAYTPEQFTAKYLKERFDGGFNITSVRNSSGSAMNYFINKTMMRIELPEPLEAGKKISFSIDWWYKINEHIRGQDRSGWEHFKEDGNKSYVIAQFYPRMCVYNDVEGWQNLQFWGDGEFALNFGDYEVEITAPSDFILDGTGKLQNRKEVFTSKMMERYELAKKTFDKPVLLVTQEEAEAAEKTKATTTKTWKFEAENVRDFAFATSRKYIYEMMAVDVMGKNVMAVSIYPKEGNPLWEQYSTKAVAQTLKTYSNMTFQYPYHKAISVHFRNIGMEYPMICWNYGRPDKDGNYSERLRRGMISVIIHEIGHNFFPMIVNSDERQWGWMDEGLNTFLQYLTEQDLEPGYLSRRGPVPNIIPYMSGDQDNMTPIMTMADNVNQLGNNAYGKPSTALNILRETVMGHEMFDYAFKTYSQRWMFKHPTPEDFFRSMEDASAMDLDWFWWGWFYTTDYTDIGIESVKKYYISGKPNAYMLEVMKEQDMAVEDVRPLVYTAQEGSDDIQNVATDKSMLENSQFLKDYLFDNFTAEERAALKNPKFFYEVTFNKPGGLVMPLIVKYTYADNTTETLKYPARVWRMNEMRVTKVIPTTKEIVKIEVDPDAETADIDTSNNTWPPVQPVSRFDQFKAKQ